MAINLSQGLRRWVRGGRSRAVPMTPQRRALTWVMRFVVAVLLAMFIHSLVANPRFQWDVVGQYFTESSILNGLKTTVILAAVAMALGVILGAVLALMRSSSSVLVAGISTAYTTALRSVPLLVQLLFWFNLSALYPQLSLGIPFGPPFISGNVNSVVTPIAAAIIGLSLHEAAYMAEILRSGLLAIDAGQHEAAMALGMPSATRFRYIVMPQVIRIILPPTGNRAITMVKNISLVSVISVTDLLYSAQLIYSRTFNTIPLLIVASIWYFVLTVILTIGQRIIERRFGRGWQRAKAGGRAERLAPASEQTADVEATI